MEEWPEVNKERLQQWMKNTLPVPSATLLKGGEKIVIDLIENHKELTIKEDY